jgi:amino-acid N-acetyltransferase
VTELRAATESDIGEIRLLLEQAGLPTSDLTVARPQFTVLREGGRIVAAGALQAFGSIALVRSVVVVGDRRLAGLGEMIVQALEQGARAARIGQLILLTQTATGFFARQGYRVMARIEVPEDVLGSEEFRSLCPASAICMIKILDDSR